MSKYIIVRPREFYEHAGVVGGVTLSPHKTYKATIATNQPEWEKKGLVFVEGILLNGAEYFVLPKKLGKKALDEVGREWVVFYKSIYSEVSRRELNNPSSHNAERVYESERAFVMARFSEMLGKKIHELTLDEIPAIVATCYMSGRSLSTVVPSFNPFGDAAALADSNTPR